MQPRKLRQLNWTEELSSSFWRDLAGSDFGERTAFARTTSAYLIELVHPHLSLGETVLDYGGGDNLYLVRDLLKAGFRVACFEPNSDVESRNADLKANQNFLGAVAVLKDEQFDAIFLSEVIEHLPDEKAKDVLKKLRIALKAHGTIIVTTPDNEDLFTNSRYCPTCRTLFHPWGHVRSFDAGSLERTLRECGFIVEELHSVDFSATREPIEEWKRKSTELHTISERLLRLVNSAEERLDPDEIQELRAAARALTLTVAPGFTDPRRRHIGFGGTLVAVSKKASD